jgi:hypothetical protein
VVNLFVFQHLIPQFQAGNLDISQIGIEVPVQVSPESDKAKPGVVADIVVWPHIKATMWRRCRPLARIEWKNISCREENLRDLERQHERDISRLNQNRRLACVSYAVLTDQRDRHVEIRCKRIADGKDPEDLFPRPLRRAATYPEKATTDLQRGYRPLLSRPQACPDCIALSERQHSV